MVADLLLRVGEFRLGLGAEFADFKDAEAVGLSASRNMAVKKEQLEESMRRLSDKSKAFASGAAPSVEFNDADRKAAKEDDVKKGPQR